MVLALDQWLRNRRIAALVLLLSKSYMYVGNIHSFTLCSLVLPIVVNFPTSTTTAVFPNETHHLMLAVDENETSITKQHWVSFTQ